MAKEVKLRRVLGLPMITFYGLGTIVGGGVYALMGKVAAEAGMFMPVAFATASLIAMFSAFSYAELSARYPFSAGEAHYVSVAFRKLWPSAVVGWAVIATGVVSAATLADAFAGFARIFFDAPHWLIVCLMVIGLGLVAAWGIGQSAILALIITVIELSGLIAVVFAASDYLPTIVDRWQELTPDFSAGAWSGIFLGAYLAFYSYVGFEDMVNVAEEVKHPQRNLPIAILLSLGLTTVLYFCVALSVVLAVDQKELAASDSPLSLVFAKGSREAALITAVGMLSGVNGALIQIIMASRVAYGLAQRQQAPRAFATVNQTTQTPLVATISITFVVLVLALWLPIVTLAKVTSTILLLVYAAVNFSLVLIKRRPDSVYRKGPTYPIVLPIIGTITCVGFLILHAAVVLSQ